MVEKDEGALVSIGLPVYNGERYLATAIESVLDQSYRNLELIISDNASTDGTEAICRRYAAQDRRIHYRRNDENIGAAANYNATFDEARGRYFKWLAHDDAMRPEFIERCVDVLESDPSIVVAYPITVQIDEVGDTLGVVDKDLAFDGPDPVQRFHRTYRIGHLCNAFFGLIRMDVLRHSGLHGNFPLADRVLLSELALWGRIVEVPEELMLSREHPGRSIYTQTTWLQNYIWHDPSRREKIGFPVWRRYKENAASVTRAPLTAGQRVRAYGLVIRWSVRNTVPLVRDLLNAARFRLMRESA
jgi:glycosyltransferase involved in cell wall biosynthesis